MSNVERRKLNEKKIIKEMILLYYKDENNREAQELIEYSFNKIDKCPVIEYKTFCSNCHINCFDTVMRSKIKIVMRYSGPRMLFRHPILTIKHAILTFR